MQEHWPQGVERIGIEDLDRLGIDRENQLFWDGRRIEIHRRLDLTGVQKLAAILVTLFAILGGLGALLSGLNDGAAFFCARGIHALGCPAPSDAAR